MILTVLIHQWISSGEINQPARNISIVSAPSLHFTSHRPLRSFVDTRNRNGGEMEEGRVGGPSINGFKILNPNMLGIRVFTGFHLSRDVVLTASWGNTIKSCILQEKKFILE